MSFDEDWKEHDDFYDWKLMRQKRPNVTSDTPYSMFRQIREDAWECGDPSLLSQAGSYFQRLFKMQRRLQAEQRQKELKQYGHWKTPFVFYYPINNWFQHGLKLVHFDYVEKHPFLSLYTYEMPKFTDPRKYTRYIEDMQTLKVFPYDRQKEYYGERFIFLQQH